eukprot:COSAG02_NODE_3182_length_7215_cov_20.148539_6_plen_147_part_00
MPSVVRGILHAPSRIGPIKCPPGVATVLDIVIAPTRNTRLLQGLQRRGLSFSVPLDLSLSKHVARYMCGTEADCVTHNACRRSGAGPAVQARPRRVTAGRYVSRCNAGVRRNAPNILVVAVLNSHASYCWQQCTLQHSRWSAHFSK